MRQRVAQMSREELDAALAWILEGGEDSNVAVEQAGEVSETAGLGPCGELDPEATEAIPLVHEPPAHPVLLTVRVDVDHMSPPIWRRLQVHGETTLEALHMVLQMAFAWRGYHLHRFWPGSARDWRGPHFLTEMDISEGEDGISESEVRLDQVLRRAGDRLFYTYDFGDEWNHTITLEAVEPADDTGDGIDLPAAVCLAGRRAGPLEDSGGPGAYQELVEARQQDPTLSQLEEYRRDWVPTDWDPEEFDLGTVNQALALVALSPEELLEGMRLLGERDEVAVPVAVQPLIEMAPPMVLASLVDLTIRVSSQEVPGLTPEDLAAMARPYRYVVDLAGADGIPLTAAGYMKPSFVRQIYVDLGLDAHWYGSGNREDQTLPVAELRQMCQQVGLLRKYKGRLLRTSLAASLDSDEEFVKVVAAKLLHHRDPYIRAGLGLWALVAAANGEVRQEHAREVAEILSECGLSTTQEGHVERWHVLEWCRPLWSALRRAAGGNLFGRPGLDEIHDHRAIALVRGALWPEGHN